MENRGASIQPLLFGDSPRSGHIYRNRKGPAHFALIQRTVDSSLAYYPLRNIIRMFILGTSYIKSSRKKIYIKVCHECCIQPLCSFPTFFLAESTVSSHHREKERGRKCMQDRLLIPKDKVMVLEFSLLSISACLTSHSTARLCKAPGGIQTPLWKATESPRKWPLGTAGSSFWDISLHRD